MFQEDNSGFILFPHPNNKLVVGKPLGKTLVYLVAFEPKKVDNQLSNVVLKMPGLFTSDDVCNRPEFNSEDSIDSLIDKQRINESYDEFYFPNVNSLEDLTKNQSINLISCICIGWSNSTYEDTRDGKNWVANYRDLTNEGSRLYYSIKKLHNNKEVRILTFNHI